MTFSATNIYINLQGLSFNANSVVSLDVAVQLLGDFNLDGHVNAADIGPAMQALTNPIGYETQYGVSAAIVPVIGDVNGDTQFTNADLQALLDLLKSGGGSSDSVPEPASLVLLAAGSLMLLLRRSRALIVRTPDNCQHGRSV